MVNTKRFYWLAQFGGWIAYSGLITMSVYNHMPEYIHSMFFLNVLILIITGIITTHIQRLAFIKLGWLDLRLPKLIPFLLISSLLCSVIIASVDFFSDILTNLNDTKEKEIVIFDLVLNVFSVMILVLFWNAIYFTFHFFQKSRRQEVSNLELATSKKESELKNLRSQLNPHFLFNSLNSIRALVDLDPDKAKTSIATLSNLLRQSLLLGKNNLVSISDELLLAKNYLDLEKVRFEERLNVKWEIDAQLENFEIPPFSLQMMIENAIKHGISNLEKGGVVEVRAFDDGESVNLEVRNSGNLSKVVDLGVGLKNIKQRLSLQYGDKAEFTIREENEMVIAKMKLKK